MRVGGKEIKTKWTSLDAASDFLKNNANLRELFSDEVLFDIDGDNAGESAQAAKQLLIWLKNQNISAESWYNGNRSQHIHFHFDEMRQMTNDQRKKVRIWWIRKANEFLGKEIVDESKQSGMIALEYAQHFKGTGRTKMPSGSVKCDMSNKLSAECLEYVNKQVQYTQNAEHIQPISKTQLENHPLIKYIRTHSILKTGNRHRVLNPNIAALMLQAKLSDSEAEQFAKSLNASFLDCTKPASCDILEWFAYFKQKKVQQ